MEKRYILIDLDGTLACGEPRLDKLPPKSKWKDIGAFDEFNDACYVDTVIQDTSIMIDALLFAGYIPVFLTSRTVSCSSETVRWFEDKVSWWKPEYSENMYFRDNNDVSSSVDYKRAAVEMLIDLGYDFLFAIDDEPAVVDMLRDYMPAWQVRDWRNKPQP